MPDILASCHFCGGEYEYETTFAVDDDFGRCEECNNETCKHCCLKKKGEPDFNLHHDCQETQEKEV